MQCCKQLMLANSKAIQTFLSIFHSHSSSNILFRSSLHPNIYSATVSLCFFIYICHKFSMCFTLQDGGNSRWQQFKMADIVQDCTKKVLHPHMFRCPLYIVHTQHKESMLCQTKGGLYAPHTFG